MTPDGDPIDLLQKGPADGPLIEAPALIKMNGVYFLFFSSHCTSDPSYDISYATASSVTGPYTKTANPLLQSGSFGLTGPGSCGLWGDKIAFAALVSGNREMFTGTMSYSGTVASVSFP